MHEDPSLIFQYNTEDNEMVYTGDTEISLHIRAPWNSGEGDSLG